MREIGRIKKGAQRAWERGQGDTQSRSTCHQSPWACRPGKQVPQQEANLV